jgi:hypothetical protein
MHRSCCFWYVEQHVRPSNIVFLFSDCDPNVLLFHQRHYSLSNECDRLLQIPRVIPHASNPVGSRS